MVSLLKHIGVRYGCNLLDYIFNFFPIHINLFSAKLA
jgi:hypothetical protein